MDILSSASEMAKRERKKSPTLTVKHVISIWKRSCGSDAFHTLQDECNLHAQAIVCGICLEMTNQMKGKKLRKWVQETEIRKGYSNVMRRIDVPKLSMSEWKGVCKNLVASSILEDGGKGKYELKLSKEDVKMALSGTILNGILD